MFPFDDVVTIVQSQRMGYRGIMFVWKSTHNANGTKKEKQNQE